MKSIKMTDAQIQKWEQKQRDDYKAGRMEYWKIKKLKEAGFDFEGKANR